MAIQTVSYSLRGDGWDSFHSFIPDWMIGLNNSLYTWRNGNLYRHDSNQVRNSYYGTTYPSTITVVFDQAPTDTKIFRTLCLEGDSTWGATMSTNLNSGFIPESLFVEKEGEFYSNIRRNQTDIDTKALSTQGVGNIETVNGLVIGFSFDIESSVCVGDNLYVNSSGTLTLVGPIMAVTSNSITLSSSAVTLNPNDFVAVVKDSIAESYGLRGYFMSVELTNTSPTGVELFSVTSEVDKSYP